jgi:pyrophosphatase PpaX
MNVHNWDKISVGFIGVDDVQKSKPDPEMVLKSIEKLGMFPYQTVMIGDSTYDILAGKAAGAMTIAVCTKHSADVFQKIGADIILDSITNLKEFLPLELPKKN